MRMGWSCIGTGRRSCGLGTWMAGLRCLRGLWIWRGCWRRLMMWWIRRRRWGKGRRIWASGVGLVLGGVLKSYVAWGLRRVAFGADSGLLNQPKIANSEFEGTHVRAFE